MAPSNVPARREGADVQLVDTRRGQRRRLPARIGPCEPGMVHRRGESRHAVRLRRAPRIRQGFATVDREAVADDGSMDGDPPPAVVFRGHGTRGGLRVGDERHGTCVRGPNAKCHVACVFTHGPCPRHSASSSSHALEPESQLSGIPIAGGTRRGAVVGPVERPSGGRGDPQGRSGCGTRSRSRRPEITACQRGDEIGEARQLIESIDELLHARDGGGAEHHTRQLAKLRPDLRLLDRDPGSRRVRFLAAA